MKILLCLSFLNILLLSACETLRAQAWSSSGLSYPGMVWTFTEYNGAIEAGGTFSSPNEIRAMAVYNGDLYSGGTTGGASTSVYKNGMSIGTTSGNSNLLYAFAVYNSELYVAGNFTSINGVTANNIARWNGTAWSAAGSGVGSSSSDFSYALCVFNNELYAAGNFGSVKWNGTTWSSFASFFSGAGPGLVRALGVYNGNLYAGGFFDNVDGVNAVNVAMWNNSSWSGIGDIGIAGDISDGLSVFAEYNGGLYCGGNFSVAGGTNAENIARWNGGGWSALGTGTNGVVNALVVNDSSLYAGGNFSAAGGISVSNVARWTMCNVFISPSGPTTFCPGENVLLSAASGTAYQWKKNGISIPGATLSSYSATASGLYYCVVTTTGCGNIVSNYVIVTVNPHPSAAITYTGSTTFCMGDSLVLNAPTGANKTYQWKKGGNDISGASNSTYIATTGGSYKVTVTNTVTGCSKTTVSATVLTTNPQPSTTITPQGPTTFCTGGSVLLKGNSGTGLTYQWKKGGNNIAGATNKNFTATIAGVYKLKVTNSYGCPKLSPGVTVSVPCREGEPGNMSEWESEMNVNVFPNPNSGEFTIKFSNKPNSPIQIELTDELGKVVKRFETDDETVVINESNLAKGIYCLTARNMDEVVIKKINVVK